MKYLWFKDEERYNILKSTPERKFDIKEPAIEKDCS